MRLRRAYCLTCYWHRNEFIVHRYPQGQPVALPVPVAEILDAFGTWCTPEQAAKNLPSYDPQTITEAVDTLLAYDLLLTEGSARAAADEHLAQHWEHWAPEAAFFHYGTQHDVYEAVSDEDRHALVADGRPVLFTSYPHADRVLLPRIPAPLRAPLGDVLYERRTHRRFGGHPVPLPTLAALLATVFGPVDYIDGGGFGALIRRTSPQGGARQELDAYLGIRAVDGTAPGWYHYNAREHSLELLADGCTSEELGIMCGSQHWAGGASFVVVLVARIERMLVKYRNPRAYRVCLLDAGHLGQAFALVAVALGLGPFQTGAFHDTAVTERLGLDGVTATPVYIVGAGPPTGEPDSVPAGLDAFRVTTLDPVCQQPARSPQ